MIGTTAARWVVGGPGGLQGALVGRGGPRWVAAGPLHGPCSARRMCRMRAARAARVIALARQAAPPGVS